jgi:hypothetical protein
VSPRSRQRGLRPRTVPGRTGVSGSRRRGSGWGSARSGSWGA